KYLPLHSLPCAWQNNYNPSNNGRQREHPPNPAASYPCPNPGQKLNITTAQGTHGEQHQGNKQATRHPEQSLARADVGDFRKSGQTASDPAEDQAERQPVPDTM